MPSFNPILKLEFVFFQRLVKNILPLERVEDSEEYLAYYSPQSFYLVQIGDVIHSNYQVLYIASFRTMLTIWIYCDL